MPIVLGAWMFAFRRDYLRPLYTEPVGLAMLGSSIVMVILGGLWLRKLVKVVV
jgi:tight adherence protein B